ncbi:hypothetical protein ACFQBQ_07450 [Granulicella cerasi]|uniref:Uncharacterized protein n=1 Tax=Granulicella cerasi TaxID=741063 RepID=A0ABW1Z7T8_9BACT
MQSRTRLARVAAAIAPLAVLSGCSVKSAAPPTTYTSGATLQGQVLAGRNYMAGATVKIYETQPNGVATNGVYVGQAKLLQTLTANTLGGWSTSGISCTSPDQLYITAEGGVPYGFSGSSISNTATQTNNPNSLMMTAIGDCSALTSGSASNNVVTTITNEASTIAAVWALRNFISVNGTTVNVTSAATNYAGTNGTGTVGNYAGLAHAFLNANALLPYKLGAFTQYTNGAADMTTGGLVPVQELNSLAYTQYLCTMGNANLTAGDFSYCSTLYQLATPASGTVPTNSLQAMLNIALSPATNAQSILTFSLTPIPGAGTTGPQTSTVDVYYPELTSLGTAGSGGANDWSVAIYYMNGYGATTTAQGSVYPQWVTIDANDEVFYSNPSASTSTQGNVIALSSNGTNLWTSATDTTNLTSPRGVAADQNGHVWVVNGGTTTATAFVQEMDAKSGSVIARFLYLHLAVQHRGGPTGRRLVWSQQHYRPEPARTRAEQWHVCRSKLLACACRRIVYGAADSSGQQQQHLGSRL